MTQDRHARLAELFLAAVDLPDGEREAFLTEECADDPGMHIEVQKLLDADGKRVILDTPALGHGVADVIDQAVSTVESVPSQVGQYEVLDVIGRGGMGTVYRARQASPNRVVALKLIRSDLMSDSMAHRFRFEGEVLGRLQHPGIAQIFEAGDAAVPCGRQPFLAMEWVDGLPLLEYARTHQLGIADRMALMSRICLAVHHAHQHGVIHRDLKPGNILVTASAQPKVLDFGVARATDSVERMTVMLSGAVQLVGTLAYMSPEQVAGDGTQVDARSDIYTLGVVAHELLAGRLPYEIEGASIPQAAQIIQDVEPVWPRATGIESRDDVRVIIGKALDKDKSRRYHSAAAMADDIDRYLRDEPILARPTSAVYQLRKFTRRHKGLVGGGVVAVLLLLLGIAGTSVGLVRARNEAFKSNAVNAFFTEVLSSADPFSTSGGGETSLVEILDGAAERIDGAFPDQPHVEAAVRMTIGKTYGSLARYEEAADQLQSAFELNRAYYGEQHALVAEGLRMLATNRVHWKADYETAEEWLEQALAIQRGLAGSDDAKAVEILRDLAWTLKESKAYERATALYSEALARQRKAVGDDNELTAGILNDLGGIARAQGRLDEADRLYEASLALFRRFVDETHPYIGTVESNLAVVLSAKGDHAGAEKRYRAAIRALSTAIGENHPRVGRIVNNLASLLHEQNKLVEADVEYRRSLDIFRESVGEDHADFASTLNNYALVLWSLGKFEECADAYRRFAVYLVKAHGRDYWHVHLTNFYLGETLNKLDRVEEAKRLMVEARRELTDQFGPEDERSQYATRGLTSFLKKHGESESALRLDASRGGDPDGRPGQEAGTRHD